tara:strand:- start:182 stop:319 length:138 start_codon:yes stop_codon:yes gene_type:complete
MHKTKGKKRNKNVGDENNINSLILKNGYLAIKIQAIAVFIMPIFD